MLNDDFKAEKKEKAEYPPLPENVYQVELLDVTMQEKPTYDTRNKPDAEKKYEQLLTFQFTLLAGKDKDGQPLRGRNIWRNFVPSYLYIGKKGKNVLYQIIEAVLDRELTKEEDATGISGKQLNSLIGKQCRIVVKNNKKDENIYSNIESFLPSEAQYNSLTDEEKKEARVKAEDSNKQESYEEEQERIEKLVDEAPF